VFHQKSEAPTPQEMMMSNPDMMMNMMKGNITGFLPQVPCDFCCCIGRELHDLNVILHQQHEHRGGRTI
jgi:hypothetical protein